MTAPQQNRRETIEFPPNVPITLALAYSEPRMVSGQRGERAMFTTTENRALFLDPEVAGRITALGINVRESFTITRHSTGKKGAPDTWTVARVAGEQGNGTFAVPKLPESAPGNGGGFNDRTVPQRPELAPPAKPPQRAANAAGGALVEEANALVDIYAQVLDRAIATYGGKVSADEVRSLVVTAYIQRRQLSSVA